MSGLVAQVELRRGDFLLEIALTVPAGRTVAVLGPNGAGKTTLIEAIAGLTRIDGGRIALDGHVLDEPATGVFVPPERRHIGVVFQDYLLFPHMTIAENVAFGAAMVDDTTDHWLDALGLADLRSLKPAALSGGQAQRVALARALVTEPRLLLLDEPLAALDVTTRARLRRLIGEHVAAIDAPRLLVTHDPTEAFLLADEIVIVEDGAVTQQGSAEDLRLRPRTQYAADLAGSNLLEGVAADGKVTVNDWSVQVADHHTVGPVLAIIQPRAIALYPDRPDGSPRNTWRTTVTRVENLGERVRVQLGDPLPVTAEITPESVTSLHLSPETPVWISIKATEIDLIEL